MTRRCGRGSYTVQRFRKPPMTAVYVRTGERKLRHDEVRTVHVADEVNIDVVKCTGRIYGVEVIL